MGIFTQESAEPRSTYQAKAALMKDLGAPGVCADYAPNDYAVLLTDPDGNHIEAVRLV
ncbi:hypothetical protein GCM10007901_16680 [Dyella acidisoli]|uniref:Glyoxalase n=1 Tax=Dyella acidisoli TaxID=1867834 RepID=A0ABQ5XPQ0_9GAMM|nr:hypothetical protein GCM10007901_16680 [Dyella acidisoli]